MTLIYESVVINEISSDLRLSEFKMAVGRLMKLEYVVIITFQVGS